MLKNRSLNVMGTQSMRFVHSIAPSGATAAEGAKSFTVYDSPEAESFINASKGDSLQSWDAQVMASPYKSKFFGLLPF